MPLHLAARRRAVAALLALAGLGAAACAPASTASRPAAVAGAVPAPAPDSSRTSLDWPGRYTGVVPCADCEGIETTLELRDDERYALTTRYLGTQDAGRTLEGSFGWGDEGSRVHGFAGCNTFAGSFEHRAGSRLRFAPLAVTQRACAELASETELLRILASVDGYALAGRTLSLHRARMAPLARFEAVYP